jgi:ABC-2 type transport system permease protein
MRRILAVAMKELRHIWRDKRTLGVLLFVPLFLLIMFGYAVRLDVYRLPVAVFDYDHTAASRFLSHSLFHDESFVQLHSPERRPQALLDRGQAGAVLVIPRGYQRALLSGSTATVQLLVDGSSAVIAAAARGYLKRIITSAALASSRQERRASASHAGASTSAEPGEGPIDYRPRVWFNPEMDSHRFLVPGLVAFILVITAVISTALSIVREKEHGTMEQIIVSPLSPVELVVGKTLPYMLLSLVVAAGVLGASALLFAVEVRGSVALLFAVTLLFLLACLGQGLFISSLADTQQLAFLIAVISTLLPSFILSGFVFPIENMPPAIRVFTYLVPARYYLVCLRGIMLKSLGASALWPQLLGMVVFTAATAGASAVRLAHSRGQ